MLTESEPTFNKQAIYSQYVTHDKGAGSENPSKTGSKCLHEGVPIVLYIIFFSITKGIKF
jgi:hypothetical protein